MKPLSNHQKKKIIKDINKISDIEIKKLPYQILQFGKEKLRLFSGNLSKQELNILDRNLKIETAGLYFAKKQNQKIELTPEGLELLKSIKS